MPHDVHHFSTPTPRPVLLRCPPPPPHPQALKVAHASFEKFQKARLDFASEVLDLAGKPFYVEALQSEGAVSQLKLLLRDSVRCGCCWDSYSRLKHHTPTNGRVA